MRFSTNNLLYSVLQFQFLNQKKPLLLVRIEQVIHKIFHYIICVYYTLCSILAEKHEMSQNLSVCICICVTRKRCTFTSIYISNADAIFFLVCYLLWATAVAWRQVYYMHISLECVLRIIASAPLDLCFSSKKFIRYLRVKYAQYFFVHACIQLVFSVGTF